MSVSKRILSRVVLVFAFALVSVPDLKADTTLVATNDTWLYYSDGTLPDANWYASAFLDGAWSSGTAPLGYGDSTTNTLLNYGGVDTNKWTTYYFRKHFTVAAPAAVTGLVAQFRVDDGAAYYLNGTRVHLTRNMRDPIANNTFTLPGMNGESDNQPFQQFTINPSMLVAGDNVIAVEVHQAALGSSDVDMELGLTAVSYATTNEAGGYPANWTAYNDAAWTDTDMMTNASAIFTTNSPVALLSGPLQSTAGQVLTINSLTFATNGLEGLGMVTSVGDIPAGTDAATEFAGMIGTNNRCGWTAGTMTMTLTGLDSNKQYKTVIWCSRAGTGGTPPYSNRLTDVTISGADSFVNTSSTGLNTTIYQSTLANDSTRVQGDSAYGYVVRFDQVRPGVDGTIMFSLMPDTMMGQTQAYVNAIKVMEYAVVSGPYVDADTDGMDDNWETTYFGSTTAPNGGTNQDFDGDGSSNYDEYRAGTLPNSGSSKLEFTKVATNAPGTVVLSWAGVAGKVYNVQQSTNLSTSWSVLQSNIAGASPTTVYTGSVSTAKRFMRVQVQ